MDSEEVVRQMLLQIGEDPTRDGLLDTPRRVAKSWKQLYGGYQIDPASLFTTFELDTETPEFVVLKDVEFYSTCLVGSTFVDTPRGRIPISRIKDGEFVYCWDEDACRMTIGRATNPGITGRNQTLWRVYTDKDTVLCTATHKFLTHNRGWVKAKDLTPGDSIVALNKGTIVMAGGVPRAHVVWTGMHKAVPEHRFIYEEVNGPIPVGSHIHHINKKPNDNSPENLTALPGKTHLRLHRLEDGPTGFALFTDAQRLAMRAKQIAGIKASQTPEVRRKRSETLKRYWAGLTAEEKANRNHRVLLVEKTEWREDVWCMDVPGYENFVANGMVVHNCEHHLLPFFGKGHIAYLSGSKIVGVSKLARLLDCFARRAQIQERIGRQVVEALDLHLGCRGAICVLEASHFCMRCRGVEKQGSTMITRAATGALAEFNNPWAATFERSIF